MTTIGANAFGNCNSLTSVNFPNVTTIGDNAFDRCYSLTSVKFPNVTAIGGGAFSNCTSLTSVKFPQTVTLTGTTNNTVFSNCHRLGEEIPELTVSTDSDHVVDDKTGTSQGRNAATYDSGVITFNPVEILAGTVY